MYINLTELFSQDGKAKEYDAVFERSSVAEAKVISYEPFTVTIAHSSNRNIEITGQVSILLSIPCSRCLDPVEVPMEINLQKKIDAEKAIDEDGEEVFCLDGCILDLDSLIADDIIIDMPMKVLCKEDCKGICNRCGANLNHESCDCDHTELDPRMAKFLDVFAEAAKKE